MGSKNKKYHIFRLALPAPLYQVIKNSTEYGLPGTSFFLNIFADAICKACNDNPEEIATLLKEIYIHGLTIKRGAPSPEATISGTPTPSETPPKEKKETNEVETLKSLEKEFEL